MKTRERKMENGGWRARSVLECDDWRGTGLAPLWNESSAQMNPAHVKAACALTPLAWAKPGPCEDRHPPQSKTWWIFGALLTFLAITISVRAQNFSIGWAKIADGSSTSSGGAYSVSGTIGPAVAGAVSGGNYTLENSQWGIIAGVQASGVPLLAITAVGLLLNGDFQLAFNDGDLGQTYMLQASTNLTNWVTVLTFTCTNSPMVVVDPDAGSYHYRFYRIAQ